jgi:hypothetical protein
MLCWSTEILLLFLAGAAAGQPPRRTMLGAGASNITKTDEAGSRELMNA